MLLAVQAPPVPVQNGAAVQPSAGAGSEIVLHERLTSYLDLVEVCLLGQISARSEAFFGASGALL